VLLRLRPQLLGELGVGVLPEHLEGPAPLLHAGQLRPQPDLLRLGGPLLPVRRAEVLLQGADLAVPLLRVPLLRALQGAHEVVDRHLRRTTVRLQAAPVSGIDPVFVPVLVPVLTVLALGQLPLLFPLSTGILLKLHRRHDRGRR